MNSWSTDFKAPIAQSVEQHHGKVEVVSAIPARGTRTQWGISSAGRAPDLHSGGQRFDPAILHHIEYELAYKQRTKSFCYRSNSASTHPRG